MRNFWWMNPLRDEDPEAGGGDGKQPEAKPAEGETKPGESETVSKADLKAARDEAARLRQERDELKSTAEFWHEKATKAEAPAKTKKDEEEEFDIVEALNTKGTKGLDDYLKKKGFLSKAEAEALVDSRAKALVDESKLIEQYPDFEKKDSEFFKEAAKQYKLLGDDVKPQAKTAMAAKLAKAAMIEAGTWKDPKETAAAEAKRLERIAAQNGGHPGSNGEGGDAGDGKLSQRQGMFAREIIGGDKAEERYRARAKGGVQFARRVDLGTQLGAE